MTDRGDAKKNDFKEKKRWVKNSKNMKTYVVGDIHGAYKALIQCLERSGFDYETDRMIVLGDVCDRYPETKKCIAELLKIKHLDLVVGNHDMWVLDWALNGNKPLVWTTQGGDKTIASYKNKPMPKSHVNFLRKGQFWIELGEQVFVHGGLDPDIPIGENDKEDMVWDRDLIELAFSKEADGEKCKLGKYKDIFVGHTTTEIFSTLEPVHLCNVWNVNTGAGGSGKLTIMDIESKMYWQSDLTQDLYGGMPDKL